MYESIHAFVYIQINTFLGVSESVTKKKVHENWSNVYR